MLMIVSVCLPMIGALDAPAELDRAADRSETHGGSTDPCNGHDACHGVDAGNSLATAINLTDEFSWTGEETVTFYANESGATSYSSSSDANSDQYIIDPPVGYGMTVSIHWNHTGSTSYAEANAFRISLGPADGSFTSWSTNDWGYAYNSPSGEISLGTDGEGGPSKYWGPDGPQDLAGDAVVALVWCHNCYTSTVSSEYTMNITVWPSDSGHKGDYTEPQYNVILDMPDEPSSWSAQTGTFTLDGTESADLVVTFCDVWCDPETGIDVTKPDGTVDSWFPLPDFFTGWLATYTDAGTYTVDKSDSWGDGGMGLTVGISLGNFSGFLEATDFEYDDSASGHVDSTDTSDVYAVHIPENYKVNLTLTWENSADLDLSVYSTFDVNNGASGLIDYSWFSNPEFVDLGQLGPEQTIYVEVKHYTGPSTGYILDLQTEPGSPPPCFYQEDGVEPGSGTFTGTDGDATGGTYSPDDDPTNVTGLSQFQGMMCAGYDESDWYSVTVPAYHGAHVILDWPEGIDSNFNDTIDIEGEMALYLYMVTSSGYTSTVFSAPYNTFETSPAAASTNESYTWNSATEQALESTLYIRIMLESMTEDYESNYTVTVSVYNASEEPPELACQNDAFMAQPGDCADGGDDTYGSDALNISTANQTFTGYGHDEFDQYDHYRFFVPNNYLVTICVDFPAHNDVDVVLHYQTGTSTWLYTVDSSYYEHPECVNSMFDDSNQFLWLEVVTDVGAGYYEVTMEFLNPGMEPGGNQDDCGLAGSAPGGDAPDNIYPGTWDGHAFLNDSTQGDFDPYDENGSVREYWAGGLCTGWLSKSWDAYDHYSIAVPQGYYVQVDYDLDMDDDGDIASSFSGVYMYMCQIQHNPCGSANLAYFIQTASGTGIDEGTLISGLWPVGVPHNSAGNIAGPADTPGWAYLRVYHSSFSGIEDLTYELNITFHPLSDLEGGNQNDANSGGDAGTGAGSAVFVNNHLNQTQADTLANDSVLGWHGWAHGDLDTTDVYFFDVPANHGYTINWDCNEWTNGNDSCDGYHFFYEWTPSGMGGYLGAAVYNANWFYNASSSASPADTVSGIGVYNWYGVDTDGDAYAVNVTFFSLDADGDGFLDQYEIDCNTDPYNASSYPSDYDGDGICDYLDPDIDGDGIDNDFDDMDFDENSTSDLDGDGVSDEFDDDIDNDGWLNIVEKICLGLGTTGHLDANTTPSDYDMDDKCDINRGLHYTSDIDNDGVDDLPSPDWVLIDVVTQISDGDGVGDDELDYLYVDFDGDNDGVDDETDQFDFDECATDDTDRDGMPDSIDTELLTDPNDENSSLFCVPDTPTGLIVDMDDDGDGHDDDYEIACGSDPLEITDIPVDSTLDMNLGGYSNGLCDALDPDDDNDGYNDTDESGNTAVHADGTLVDLWPYDSTEWADNDGDGNGDNRDMDDDNDGWWDSCLPDAWAAARAVAEVEGVNYFPNNPDGIASDCNSDEFPNNPQEWIDTDGDCATHTYLQGQLPGDGCGDNSDIDDDGQGPTPEVPGNDMWTDADEIACGSDPLDHTDTPDDNDGDYICDAMDPDDDNDGILDVDDVFSFDDTESSDNDGDGQGDEEDLDDDNDGWSDLDEAACLTDPTNTAEDVSTWIPSDWDGDGLCDVVDGDDDGDFVIDIDDGPLDPTTGLGIFKDNPRESKDTDGDGIGDNADTDDDDDGWLDATETACANAGGKGDPNVKTETPVDHDGDGLCDAIDTDDDGDGYPDPACVGSESTLTYVSCAVGDEDRFPRDSAEWYDANEDEAGDNANPITLIDKVTYDPAPYVGIVGVIAALGYGLLKMNKGASRTDEGDAEDYTEEFEDFDFDDDDEPVDDEDDGEED